MLQVGLVDKVLDSTAIQLCVQCLTCTARCPRNIDVAGIFEDLKTVATAQERDVPEHAKTFNEAFMNAVARFGRLPELYMMGMFYLGTMNPKMAMGDAGLAVPMLTKGKMAIMPRKSKGADEVGRIYKKTLAKAKAREKAFAEAAARDEGRRGDRGEPPGRPRPARPAARAASPCKPGRRRRRGGRMTLAYYPGCSLHKSSAEYDVSVRKMLAVLGRGGHRGPRVDVLRLQPGAHDGPSAGPGSGRPQSASGRSRRRRVAGSLSLLLPAGEERRGRDPRGAMPSGPRSTRCSTSPTPVG